MEPSKPIESSGNIYKALENSENAEQALKQLNQKDRAIVLIALANLRFQTEQPDKVKTLPDGTARVVKLLTNNQVKHAQSGFFARLFKGIQNLLGRINSATLMNNFIDIKEKIKIQLPNKKKEINQLKEEIKQLENKINFNKAVQGFLGEILGGTNHEQIPLYYNLPVIKGFLNYGPTNTHNPFKFLDADALSKEDFGAISLILKDVEEQLKKIHERHKENHASNLSKQVTSVKEKLQYFENLSLKNDWYTKLNNMNKSLEKLNIEFNKLQDLNSAINPLEQDQKQTSQEGAKFSQNDLETFEQLKSALLNSQYEYQAKLNDKDRGGGGREGRHVEQCTAEIRSWLGRFTDRPSPVAPDVIKDAIEMIEKAIVECSDEDILRAYKPKEKVSVNWVNWGDGPKKS